MNAPPERGPTGAHERGPTGAPHEGGDRNTPPEGGPAGAPHEGAEASRARDATNARAKRLLGGFVVAHLAAYPITFVWAAGAVVPILARMPPRELATATRESVVKHVLLALLAPSVALFVGLHLTAIPWMRDTHGPRGMKLTAGLNVLALALGLVFTAAAWGWLFTR